MLYPGVWSRMSTITQRHLHCTSTCMRAHIDITQAYISLQAHAQNSLLWAQRTLCAPTSVFARDLEIYGWNIVASTDERSLRTTLSRIPVACLCVCACARMRVWTLFIRIPILCLQQQMTREKGPEFKPRVQTAIMSSTNLAEPHERHPDGPVWWFSSLNARYWIAGHMNALALVNWCIFAWHDWLALLSYPWVSICLFLLLPSVSPYNMGEGWRKEKERRAERGESKANEEDKKTEIKTRDREKQNI